MSLEETGSGDMDLEQILDQPEGSEDKTFAAMGVAKTIATVLNSIFFLIVILTQTVRLLLQ